MDVGMVRQRRLADDIVAQLETMILEGTLKAGERLPAERVLAERFGVSRPSLREAIQKLAAKGLLISRHGGGTFVAESLGSTFSVNTPRENVMPRFLKARSRTLMMAGSSFGTSLGKPSIIVTAMPIAFHMEANSQPITPPPRTIALFGR